MLFDDLDWTFKYWVARTGRWLTRRSVMIAPLGKITVNPGTNLMTVQMRWKQIFDSPVPGGGQNHSGSRALCSAAQIRGYGLRASDGVCGSVDDVVFDASTWHIHHLVIDLPNEVAGRKVLISPEYIEQVNREAFIVVAGLTREAICNLPAYNGYPLQTPGDEAGFYPIGGGGENAVS